MKKNVIVVQKGMKVSQKVLEKLGWKDTMRNYFGSKIFEKDGYELLYDSRAKMIDFIFEPEF